jgi:hypothetical protein
VSPSSSAVNAPATLRSSARVRDKQLSCLRAGNEKHCTHQQSYPLEDDDFQWRRQQSSEAVVLNCVMRVSRPSLQTTGRHAIRRKLVCSIMSTMSSKVHAFGINRARFVGILCSR